MKGLDGIFLAMGAIVFMQGVRNGDPLALYAGAVCIFGAIVPRGWFAWFGKGPRP